MKHKFLSLLVAIAASVGMMNAEVINGSCGTNLTWSLNTEDSTLTISGTGAMPDYFNDDIPSPWAQYSSIIKYLILEEGLSSIGNYAFKDNNNLISVTIPSSVTSIGDYAFSGCPLAVVYCYAVNPPSLEPYSITSDSVRILVPCTADLSAYQAAWWAQFYISYIPSYKVEVSENIEVRQEPTECNSNTAILYADDYEWMHFHSWEDGNTDNPRTIVITQDTFFTANYRAHAGENVVWTLDENGLLTISGTGDMYDFEFGYMHGGKANVPWDASKITSVIIEEGVTSIGDNAFNMYYGHGANYSYYYDGPTSVIIPNSMTSIGYRSFEGCKQLSSIVIPKGVTSIVGNVFDNCDSLKSVILESTTPPTLLNRILGIKENTEIVVPCGALDAYSNAEGWSSYAEMNILHYPALPYILTTKFEDPYEIGSIGVSNAIAIGGCSICIWQTEWRATTCDPNVQIQAYPRDGYKFVKWADGNTDNPRTIEITQDTTMEAIFEPLLVGKCGKDSALNWTLDTTNMALAISGSGELTENYTYIRQIESVTIGNEITSIGEYAFASFNHLNSIILGTNVKAIEQYAFASAYSYTFEDEYTERRTYPTITCYSQRPPTVRENAFDYDMPYSTIVYVPADYVSTYKAHDFWGLYDVRPLGAKPVETDEVNVTPTATTAEFIWPSVNGAATYELVIKDKSGNVICTLTFNANGQLIQLAFHAPARDKAVNHTGFLFTVTGLEEGTTYDYTIVSKDSNGNVLDTQSGSFTTTGEQGIENVDALSKSIKVIRNGQLLIEKNGKTYNIVGTEVK